MSQLAGNVYLRWNGKLLTLSDAEITCNAGYGKREPVLSSDGTVGFSVSAQTPSIEGEFIHTGRLSIAELSAIKDATITVEYGNGQTFVLTNAWWASDGEVPTSAKIKFKFHGLKGEFVHG